MQKIALTPRSKQLIKNYILGGAALGGSGALLTSLVNYMKTLKDNGDPQGTDGDDSTLYVNMPANKMASQQSSGPMDFTAGGLALTGGVLATAGTYALVRKLYQKMKLKELQDQLDNAQQTFVGQADAEAQQKLAAVAAGGKPMSVPTMLYSTPVAFALLSAIAAGALTNHALNKTFPRVKTPSRIMPKRVVIRRNPAPAQDGTLTDEEAKTAYDQVPEQAQFEDGIEFLANLVLSNKSAAESDVQDIVHAVADGRHDEFVENIFEYGFDAAMDTIKGASEKTISPQQKQLAIALCTKSSALSPVFSMLVSAEYNEMAPRFTKIASLQDEENKTSLVKIAGVLGALNRHDIFTNNVLHIEEVDKEAAVNSPLALEDILRIINEQRSAINGGAGLEEDGGIDEAEDMNKEDSISSDEELGTNDAAPQADPEAAPDIINELGNDDDLIDAAMSRTITPANAVAAQGE